MKLLIIYVTLLYAVNALSDKDEWSNFKVKHGKIFQNSVEETRRFNIFISNLRKIESHNAKYERGEESYFMAVNQFADLTPEEFQHRLKLQAARRPQPVNKTYVSFPKDLQQPESIDWRELGAVREVKNQGNCGDCWAFSTTGSIEGQISIRKNLRTTLSEQQLLDCSGSYGNGNCDEGGSMNNAYLYVADNGIVSTYDYPYKGVQQRCQYDASKIVTKISGSIHVERLNEWALYQAVGNLGPMSIGMNAAHWGFYGGGILDLAGCPNGDGDLDHGVLVVGYGKSNGIDYWIVKNSWGADWGESGYLRVKRGVNMCGIAIDPSYPTL